MKEKEVTIEKEVEISSIDKKKRNLEQVLEHLQRDNDRLQESIKYKEIELQTMQENLSLQSRGNERQESYLKQV